jgi:hypothetical protein
MDDGGWKAIEGKLRTAAEAMLLIDESNGKRNPPGWIIDRVRDQYRPPYLVPQESLRRWVNELELIDSICGHRVEGKIGVSNGWIAVGSQKISNGDLLPEQIIFKSADGEP